jgi:thiosulfate dehydrogenase (quinone) large subunit
MKIEMETPTALEMPPIERIEPVHTVGLQRVFGLLRMAMGFTFLWAFFDKLLGLGFSTGRDPATGAITFFGDQAWIHGASPTMGVFAYALHAGPFQAFYENLGNVTMTAQGPIAAPPAWIDWVYMLSMLLIGIGLISGVMTRLAAFGGIAWMVIFFTATAIWPEHNPFVDEHVVDTLVLVALVLANAGRYLGLGKAWQRVGFVRDRAWLY